MTLPETYQKNLCRNLNSQRLECPKFCDIRLETQDGVVNAHKIILSFYSKYFEIMFSHDEFLENKTKMVKMNSIDTKTLNEIITFFYTGDLAIEDMEMVLKFIHWSDYLDSKALSEMAMKHLRPKINIRNAPRVLTFSRTLPHLKLLSKTAREFIEENFESILECGSTLWMDWKDLYEIADRQLEKFRYDTNTTKIILITINNWLTNKTILANCPHLNYSTPPVEVSLDFQTEYKNEIKRLKKKHYVYDSTDDDLETYTTLILISKKEKNYLYYLYPLKLRKWYIVNRTLRETNDFMPLLLKQKNHTELIDIGYIHFSYGSIYVETYKTDLDGFISYNNHPRLLKRRAMLSIPNTTTTQILRPGVLSSLSSSQQFLNHAKKLMPINNAKATIVKKEYDDADNDNTDDDSDDDDNFNYLAYENVEQEFFTKKLVSSICLLQDVPRNDEDELEDYQRRPKDPRQYAALACDGKLFYVIGGENLRGDLLRSAWCYNPRSKTWKALADLPKPRSRASAFCLGGKVYIFGGVTNESARMERCEAQSKVYVAEIDEWYPGPTLRYPKTETKILMYKKELYLVGGMGFHSSFNSSQTAPMIESHQQIEMVNSLNGLTRSIRIEATQNPTLINGVFVNLTGEFIKTQLKNGLDKNLLIE